MDPITISGIIAVLVTDSSIASMIIGAFGSYIANHIPLLKRSPNFEKSAKKCFHKAAKDWSKKDISRDLIYSCWVKTYDEFLEYLKTDHPAKEWVAAELIPLWFNEMRNNEDCRQLVIEAHLQFIQNAANEIQEEQKRNRELLEQIAAYQRRFRTKGTMEFEKNDDYIKRTCDKTDSEIYFLRSVGGYQEKSLLDFVLTGQDNDRNQRQFALYSSMQTGKTTELQQLGWELQNSGIFQPILVSVSLVQELKFDDLPEVEMLGHKPIVLLIDALDETSEDHYKRLLKEIDNYTRQHKNMLIVVSCRWNFKSIATLDGYYELDLMPLSWEQTMAYIQKKMPQKAAGLIDIIDKKELYELANNPFTLNALIEMYDKDGHLPLTQSELFEKLIQKSIQHEAKNGPKDFILTEDEEMICMERVAGMMLMMGKRKLTETEFNQLLKQAGEAQYDHLRYDIIQRRSEENGNVFAFKQNAYHEYLAARMLLRCQDMDEVKQIVCFENTNQVKSLWYTPMLLWMEMVATKAIHLKNDAATWLKNDSWALAIHAPESLINDQDKGDVLIKILEQHKKEGTYFYDYGNDLYIKTRKLPLTVVRYVRDEWRKVNEINVHLRNIQLLTRMIDWKDLRLKDRTLADNFENLLFSLLQHDMFKEGNAEWIYVVMTNKYFLSEEKTRRLYGVVKDRNDIESVEVMMSRIAILNNVDGYADYIVRAINILGDDRDTNSHHSVLRGSIYKALERIHIGDCPSVIMSIPAKESYWRFTEDKEKALSIYQRLAEEAKQSPCFIEGDEHCDLVCLMKEAEKYINAWKVPEMPVPTEEQIDRSLEYAKRNLEVLFDMDEFKKQAQELLSMSEDENEMNLRDYFESEKNLMEPANMVSYYVTTFLQRQANKGHWVIDKKKALESLDNQGLYDRFRLGELKAHLTGGIVTIPLNDEQHAKCVETAKEVLCCMLSSPFNGQFYPHEQVALSLFVKGDYDIEKSEQNCRDLLRFVGLPLETSIFSLYDEDVYSSLLERLKVIYPMEVILNKMLELVKETVSGSFDYNAYNVWMTTLLNNEYQPALEMVLGDIEAGGDNKWLAWLPQLVKNEASVHTLMNHAEHASTAFVLRLCKALKTNAKHRGWIVKMLEGEMDGLDTVELRRCLEILYQLGSKAALEYTIRNPQILKEGDSMEFKYASADDILPLVEAYKVLTPTKLFPTSYNSLLESLYQIAMNDEDCLEKVQEAVTESLPHLAGTNPMTPAQWVTRLKDQYIVEHQYIPTAGEALKRVCEIVRN